jgi:hypothetical protein
MFLVELWFLFLGLCVLCNRKENPHCRDSRPTDGGKVVSLYSPETLFFCFWYSFLLEAEQTPRLSLAGRIKQIEKN